MAGVPENGKAIYDFLIKAGFSTNAAAGIMGNIEQESGGNPEAGSNPPGKGLIQKLGDPGGSLQTELGVMMAYIHANGSVADINAHAQSPAAAATYFSDKYERPGIPDIGNRIASANLVAQAAHSNKWPISQGSSGGNGIAPALDATGGLTVGGAPLGGLESLGKDALGLVTGTASTVGDVASAVQGIGKDVNTAMHFLAVLGKPAFWLRIGAFLVGLISAGVGIYFLGKSIGVSGPSMPSVVPVPV